MHFPLTIALLCFLAPIYVPQQPPPLERTRVHVTVVDEQDKPVPGAEVSGTCRVMQRMSDKLMGEGFCLVEPRTADSRGTLVMEMTKSHLGSSLRLRASHEGAFTAEATEIKDPVGEPSVTLRISRQHARALQVRVVNEQGKPMAGVAVAAHHAPYMPGGGGGSPARPVLPDDKAAWVTDAEGRFTSPRILDPDGTYLLRLKAEGCLHDDTPWTPMGKHATLDFGTRTMQRKHIITGQVRDRQGQPVAGAKVLWLDARQRVQGTTDAAGQFRLEAAHAPPGFLFVEKDGFRFHGQRHQPGDSPPITLVRRSEPSGKTMATLPPLPRAQRKELAAKLIEPCLVKVVEQPNFNRYGAYYILGQIDAKRMEQMLEKHPLKDERSASAVRQLAGHALGHEDLAAAQAYIATIKDPAYRCYALMSIADDLPADQRERKLALLRQAWQEGKQAAKPEQLVSVRSAVGRRLWAVGERAEATQLLRDGHAMARELPRDGLPDVMRRAFAESLALIDLPAGLELLQPLQGDFTYWQGHRYLGYLIAATNPDGAERIFDMLLEPSKRLECDRGILALGLCYRFAATDLPRARKIADTLKERDPAQRARAYGLMAQALAKSQPREALALLDEAYALLTPRTDLYGDTAVMGGLLLPVAELIDPSLVPEFYWRALSFSPAFGGPNSYLVQGGTPFLRAMALALARYDRDMALSLIALDKPGHHTVPGHDHHLLLAAVLADPARALALIEQLPPGPKQDEVRFHIANFLLTEGERRWRAWHRSLGHWHVDEENY